MTRDNTPPITRLPTQASGRSIVPITNKIPQETQPLSQPVIIGSQVVASSSSSAAPWECTFQLGDKALPSNSYVQIWRNGEGGHMSNSLEQALLLHADMKHYSGCWDDDLVLKLKWHIITVRFTFVWALLLIYIYIYICSYYYYFLFIYF